MKTNYPYQKKNKIYVHKFKKNQTIPGQFMHTGPRSQRQ